MLSRIALLFAAMAVCSPLFAQEPPVLAPSATPVPTPSSTPVAPKTITLNVPHCGFDVTLPENWEHLPEMARYTAYFAAMPRDSQKSIFFVQIGIPVLPSLTAHAKKLVADGSNGVIKGIHKWNGQDAVEVTRKADMPMFPFEALLLTKRGKYTYTIRSCGVSEQAAKESLETAKSGWKWRPALAAPFQHLKGKPKRVIFPGLELQAYIPEIMNQLDAGEDWWMYGVKDFRTNITAFTFSYREISGDRPMQLGEMRDGLSALLQQQFPNIPQNLKWISGKGLPARTLSVPIHFPKGGLGEAFTGVTQYGLIKLSPTSWGLLTFTMTGQSKVAVESYSAAAQRIFESVTPVKSPKTPAKQ